jgi:hypothetical protein
MRIPSPDAKVEFVRVFYSGGGAAGFVYQQLYVVPAGKSVSARHRIAHLEDLDGLKVRWTGSRTVHVELIGPFGNAELADRCFDCAGPAETVHVEYQFGPVRVTEEGSMLSTP